MRTTMAALLLLPLVAYPVSGQSEATLKVFISVDMEGITGLVNGEETSRTGKDYEYFRRIMTAETNAAIEGAAAAGAADILVRDSHGSARNILPDMLDQRARLLRDWSGGPQGMMEGLDESFDAVVFIGYHAKAGTADAILDHTWSGSVTDVSVNGVSLPEAGFNALIAGHYDVPVVFVAGDRAICEQAEALFGTVETVAVKEGIGAAAISLHPEIAQQMIRTGVERALRNIDDYRPYKMDAPYTLVLKLKTDAAVYNGSFYPGATRTGDWELTYTGGEVMDVVLAFSWMMR
ncbi:MAG: M55 family metallopeptidase [Gemmatimonadota bacterium]|nr:MAG: M55 family metallopeptidase [Gemmatimonadota bacterium]